MVWIVLDGSYREKDLTVLARSARDAHVHKALFLPGGLADGTELGYYARNQVVLAIFILAVCACVILNLRNSLQGFLWMLEVVSLSCGGVLVWGVCWIVSAIFWFRLSDLVLCSVFSGGLREAEAYAAAVVTKRWATQMQMRQVNWPSCKIKLNLLCQILRSPAPVKFYALVVVLKCWFVGSYCIFVWKA